MILTISITLWVLLTIAWCFLLAYVDSKEDTRSEIGGLVSDNHDRRQIIASLVNDLPDDANSASRGPQPNEATDRA